MRRLRRVLAMMIDWMDKEGSVEARFMQKEPRRLK